MEKIESSIRLVLYGAGCTKQYADEQTDELMKIIRLKFLSQKQIAEIAVQETALLEDYKRNNNHIGIKIQEGKIEILDKILRIK